MLSVEQREAIRRAYYVEHKSRRQIARELHCSRKTVDKAILSAAPTPYTRSVPYDAPKLGAFKERLAELLAERDQQPPKQRYTSAKLYEILHAEGYRGSPSRIRGYISEVQQHQRRRPAFLPLEFDPGDYAQVDWGEACAVIAGERTTVQLFVMRLCFSRRTFAMAFPTQRQEAFFLGHVHAFHFFGGVPHHLTYDNLSTAVKRVLQGHARLEQQAFTLFRSHYLFESHFCTPAQGHEKGQVEHSIGFVRRNFLVPVPVLDSFAVLNAHLLARCEAGGERIQPGQQHSIRTLWQQEQQRLRPLPADDLPCCATTTATRTPYSQVVFETNRYSLPVDKGATQLVLKAYPFHLDILHQGEVIATHPRCYAREQDLFDPLHYLPLLAQRPGAFEHAKPLRRWRESWPACYTLLLEQLQRQWPDGRGVREFLAILQLHQTNPAPSVAQAIQHALDIGCIHADGVRLCLHQLLHPAQPPSPLDLSGQPHLAHVGSQPLALQVYDDLLEGAV
jgi:transposase